MKETEKHLEWFPVEMTCFEDLPPDKTSVFVTDGECVDIGSFDFDDGLWTTALGFVDPDSITHWMEIPGPQALGSFFVPMYERNSELKSMIKEKPVILYQDVCDIVARWMYQERVYTVDFSMYNNASSLNMDVSSTRFTSEDVGYASTKDTIDVGYLSKDQQELKESK